MKDGRKNVLIIDTSLHAMRYQYAAKAEETKEEGDQIFKFKFLNGVFDLISQFEADECILAIDSRNNWRKEVFPYYKSKRKLKRQKIDEADHPWFCFDDYFVLLNSFLADLKKNLPFKQIEIDFAEADDVAGILASSDILSNCNKIIVTSDQDYLQLLQNPLTSVYDPIKKSFMQSDDPKKDLLEKIVLGDSGDDIPSIKDVHSYKSEFWDFCLNEGVAESFENAKIKVEASEDLFLKLELKFYAKYYLKPTRARKFPKKLFNSLYKEGTFKEHVMSDPILKERFLRNNKLINLTAQPKKLKQEIIDTYQNFEFECTMKSLFEFFIFNNFNFFMEDNVRLTNLLRPLYN